MPGKAGSYKLPNGITRIEDSAFSGCTAITDISLPVSLVEILNCAFYNCAGLTAISFEGNAPVLLLPTAAAWPVPSLFFSGADQSTVYYLPEKAGWGTEYGGRPTAMWLPQ